MFGLFSTSCMDRFMLALVMRNGTLVANYFSVENFDVTIKFLQINGPAAQFFRPRLEDTCWIPIHDIITKVDPSSFGSSG